MHEPSHSRRKPEAGSRKPDDADFARLRAVLYAWGRRRGWDEDLAEDVAQSLLADCWRRGVPSWAVLQKRARGWASALLRERLQALGDLDHQLAALDDDHELPANREQSARCFRSLSERERRAFEYLLIEGLDRETTAARLAVSRGHLDVIVHRARQRLEMERCARQQE